jgi:hypothetical protein
MTKTKSKKDKNASAAGKIARKTLGLVVRVGDALEAAVAAASPAPVAPSTSTSNGAGVAGASPAPAASPAPLAASPAPPVSHAPSLPQTQALPEAQATENEPGPPAPVAVAAVSKAASEGTRALAAIEVYATQHNLEAVDMPSRDTLVAALLGGMAQHGPELTDELVRSLIDEQMRIHFRALAARSIAPVLPV